MAVRFGFLVGRASRHGSLFARSSQRGTGCLAGARTGLCRHSSQASCRSAALRTFAWRAGLASGSWRSMASALCPKVSARALQNWSINPVHKHRIGHDPFPYPLELSSGSHAVYPATPGQSPYIKTGQSSLRVIPGWQSVREIVGEPPCARNSRPSRKAYNSFRNLPFSLGAAHTRSAHDFLPQPQTTGRARASTFRRCNCRRSSTQRQPGVPRRQPLVVLAEKSQPY